MTTVVVGGAVMVLQFAEAAGLSRWLAAPLLLLGAVAVPSIGAELAVARREEIGLARLRGIHGVRLWRFLLFEPLLAIVLGTGVGLAVGALGTVLATGTWLEEKDVFARVVSTPQGRRMRARLPHLSNWLYGAPVMARSCAEIFVDITNQAAGVSLPDLELDYSIGGIGQRVRVTKPSIKVSAATGGLGWALIAFGAASRMRKAKRYPYVKAIWQGYRRGKAAKWLLGEDYERLMAEPLEAARKRLNIAPARIYNSIPPEARDQAVPRAAGA